MPLIIKGEKTNTSIKKATRLLKDVRISNRINQLDIFSDDQDDFTTSIFSELKPVNLDTEGRFVIPEDYKDYAKINNEAIFFGQGHSFQIWNPDSAKLRQEESRNRLIKEKKTLRSIINGNTNE